MLLSEVLREEDFYTDIAISPDCNVVVLASSDGILRGYNAQDWGRYLRFPTPTLAIYTPWM